MRRSTFVASVLVIVAAVAAVMGQTGNPQIGTWKMNIAKSKFTSGTGYKSATSRIEAVGGGRQAHAGHSCTLTDRHGSGGTP